MTQPHVVEVFAAISFVTVAIALPLVVALGLHGLDREERWLAVPLVAIAVGLEVFCITAAVAVWSVHAP